MGISYSAIAKLMCNYWGMKNDYWKNVSSVWQHLHSNNPAGEHLRSVPY